MIPLTPSQGRSSIKLKTNIKMNSKSHLQKSTSTPLDCVSVSNIKKFFLFDPCADYSPVSMDFPICISLSFTYLCQPPNVGNVPKALFSFLSLPFMVQQ